MNKFKLVCFVSVLVTTVLCVASGAMGDTIYNTAVLNDSPLFYWTFDEASGNAVGKIAKLGKIENAVRPSQPKIL